MQTLQHPFILEINKNKHEDILCDYTIA